MVLRSELLFKMGTNLLRSDLMHRAHEGETCKLIDGGFAFLVQALLVMIATSALVFKRYCSLMQCKYYPNPKRSVFVWFLDVSKQGLGHMLCHFSNLLFAIQLSKILVNSLDPHGERKVHADQCAWYCINFCMDSILGIPIVWGFLTLISFVAKKTKCVALEKSGYYGVVADGPLTPRTKMILCTNWSIQTSMFVLSLLITKIVVAMLILFLSDPLGRMGVFVFQGIAKYPHLELLVVMVIVPCIANIFVVWIYDNILMEGEGVLKSSICCRRCPGRCPGCTCNPGRCPGCTCKKKNKDGLIENASETDNTRVDKNTTDPIDDSKNL